LLALQTNPAEHVVPLQQGCPLLPHAQTLVALQTKAPLQKPPLQHCWAEPPQAAQTLLELHAKVLVEHLVEPLQHGWPEPPQVTHLLLALQVNELLEHLVVPPQQAWLRPPHVTHTLLELHTKLLFFCANSTCAASPARRAACVDIIQEKCGKCQDKEQPIADNHGPAGVYHWVRLLMD
jgi:hypothetical protein